MKCKANNPHSSISTCYCWVDSGLAISNIGSAYVLLTLTLLVETKPTRGLVQRLLHQFIQLLLFNNLEVSHNTALTEAKNYYYRTRTPELHQKFNMQSIIVLGIGIVYLKYPKTPHLHNSLFDSLK